MPIERLSPELDRLVSTDQELEELGNGYEVAEGPLWWHEAGHLIFSEVRGNKRRQWTPGSGITLLHESTNNANGLTRDLQGRMILCEGGAGRVTRMEPDGSITVVANSYQGMPLNRPNDVVVRSSDGSIYFTNPGAPDPEFPLPYSGVYRVSADLGTISLLVSDFAFPNGLVFSPDESILYIADYRGGRIRAFDVNPKRDVEPGQRPGVLPAYRARPHHPLWPRRNEGGRRRQRLQQRARRRVDHRPGRATIWGQSTPGRRRPTWVGAGTTGRPCSSQPSVPCTASR